MKKASLLALIAIYAVSTFGIGVREFYCCGKLQSIQVSFIGEAKQKAVKGESGMGNCCKTTQQFFKIKDDHKAANNSFDISVPSLHLYTAATVFKAPALFADRVNIVNGAHAPPGNASVPIYLANGVFRI